MNMRRFFSKRRRYGFRNLEKNGTNWGVETPPFSTPKRSSDASEIKFTGSFFRQENSAQISHSSRGSGQIFSGSFGYQRRRGRGTSASFAICPMSEEGRQSLLHPLTKQEVHRALMGMKSYKAPGSDCFQPIFFKMFWEQIGDDIWRFVSQAFETGNFDPQVTDTLLVLIPKGDYPSSFREFRPISLCNVLYKLITKVLVNRLRSLLHDMISPLYSSFIPGRGTTDNAIVLQEIVHLMHKSRKKKDVVLKLDLEKAYDRVDWQFLRETLEVFGILNVIISLIMHGISSPSISVLWNGSKSCSFTPARGLRQGDPLSPYLFVMCMERLGDMISQAIHDGSWLPI